MATRFIAIEDGYHEDGDPSYRWECEKCHQTHEDSLETVRMRECDACGEKIEAFLGLDEQEDL